MKKNIFSYIFRAWKKPRLFIHLIAVKYRQLFKLSFIAILFMATSMTISNAPVFNRIANNIADAANHLPDYHYIDGNLSIEDGQKPLYYQSDSFQLILDDEVEVEDDLSLMNLDPQKSNSIESQKLFNLFMFKNKTILSVGGRLYQLGGNNNQFLTKDILSQYLQLVINQPIISIASQWLTQLLIALIIYIVQTVVLALLLSLFNLRISQPLLFHSRVRLVIAITFIPLIGIYTIQMFFPYLLSNFFILTISLFMMMTLMMREHTLFLREKLMNSDPQTFYKSIDERFEELDYMETQKHIVREEDLDPSVIAELIEKHRSNQKHTKDKEDDN